MGTDSIEMKSMPILRHIFAYVTLGLLCGWYYFLLLLYPSLIYGIVAHRSYVCGTILSMFLVLTFTPLTYKPWKAFMYSWIFAIWREYFDMTYDCSGIDGGKIVKGQKYMFFEFPHGIFPMGQFLSASLIEDILPGQMVCGTGADVIFTIPVMRQIMAWIGTHPAKRSNISKILNKGYHCGIIPGGIAEMYLVSAEVEGIYLKKRRSTVKAAIQEGANIVPAFFFGNSKLFHKVGGAEGSSSFLAKISRKFRASILLFYGRNYLPVPFRHPIHAVFADIVQVKQSDNPTEEDIDDVMNRLEISLMKMYAEKKPSWENRPLVIS